MEFKPTSNIIESKQSQNLALDFMYDRVSGVSRDSLSASDTNLPQANCIKIIESRWVYRICSIAKSRS